MSSLLHWGFLTSATGFQCLIWCCLDTRSCIHHELGLINLVLVLRLYDLWCSHRGLMRVTTEDGWEAK